MRALRLLGAAVFAACAISASASAATLPDKKLSSAGEVVRWQGHNADPTGQGYNPPTPQTCTEDTCDSFVLDIEFPGGTFKYGPKDPAPSGVTRIHPTTPTDMPGDGVLVSIKWPTEFDQWNVYVEDMATGETVAQGADLDSNAQSVLIPQPHNGRYRVWVVPFYTNFYKQDQDYRGEARAWFDPTQRHADKTALLPRILTEAPSNFHIADVPPVPSNPTGWRFTSPGTFDNSCYADETAQFGSQRCLRFDNGIRNTGEGPLILRFAWSPDALVNNCKMEQEVIASDATVSDRDAGPCVFHPQHAHFHYQNMGTYELYPVLDSDGTPGAKPIAKSAKVGFCTVDVDYYTFGAKTPGGPRTYSFPTCNIPNAFASQTDGPYGPGSPPEYMGISAGWGDVYTWDLPAQYLDITNGVPDGRYEVVSRSNPDGGIRTLDRESETGVTCVEIKGTDVKVVKEFASQPNWAPLPYCGPGAPKVHKKKHHTKRKHHKRKHHRTHRRHHR